MISEVGDVFGSGELITRTDLNTRRDMWRGVWSKNICKGPPVLEFSVRLVLPAIGKWNSKRLKPTHHSRPRAVFGL